jgi:hypothetical protein
MTEFQLTCPLGSKCEEIRDNKAYRCAWYTKLQGNNPQTGVAMDESACAIAWLPLLQIENTRSGHSTAAAVESLRNTVAEGPVQQIRLN